MSSRIGNWLLTFVFGLLAIAVTVAGVVTFAASFFPSRSGGKAPRSTSLLRVAGAMLTVSGSIFRYASHDPRDRASALRYSVKLLAAVPYAHIVALLRDRYDTVTQNSPRAKTSLKIPPPDTNCRIL